MVPPLITRLFLTKGIVNRGAINTHRRSRLHAIRLKAKRNQLLRKSIGSWFGNTSAFNLHLPEVHNAIEERAISQNHLWCHKLCPKMSLYPF